MEITWTREVKSGAQLQNRDIAQLITLIKNEHGALVTRDDVDQLIKDGDIIRTYPRAMEALVTYLGPRAYELYRDSPRNVQLNAM